MRNGMIDVWCMTFGEPLTDEEKDDVVSKALNRGKGTDILDKEPSEDNETLYDKWLREEEAIEAADNIMTEAPFVNSMATCDCSYCKAIREAKAKQETVERHAKELKKATELLLSFDCGTEPTEFQGFALKFNDIKADPDNKAVNKWLRDCEKEIAKAFNMSEAWIHISINGSFLC